MTDAMQIERNQRVIISSEVLFQEIRGESVLLDLASENYFGLDAVGTRIWQLIDAGKSVGQILDAIEAEYDVAPATAESDLRKLLAELVEARLIRL